MHYYHPDKTKVNPNDSDANMFKAPLYKCIEDIYKTESERGYVLNFLDLDLSSSVNLPLGYVCY
jgi:hypothetical protein